MDAWHCWHTGLPFPAAAVLAIGGSERLDHAGELLCGVRAPSVSACVGWVMLHDGLACAWLQEELLLLLLQLILELISCSGCIVGSLVGAALTLLKCLVL